METRFDRSTLRWLNAGLEDTLAQARRALEDYVDGAGDVRALNGCVDQLHRLEATLSVAQVYGAAMLAGEMETLARALAGGEIPASDSAAEVLMVGLLQLPSYLEKVEGGQPDIPLSLLPLMNDLRSARGQATVSEISLFAPKLDKLIAAEPVEPEAAGSPLAASVRAARNGLLRGMLAWFQGEQPQEGVRQVRDFIARLAAQARTTRVRRLLDSVEALLVVVQENGAAADADIKRLFGQLDRYLKRIQSEGEQRAASDFPTALLKGVLYQVARSDSNDPTVAGVRRWADLANSFPDSVDYDQGLVALAGTERELLQAVKEALGQDLRTVKDVLDLYIRGTRDESSQLQPLIEPLRRIADTLGMVGQGELRARLLARDEQVRQHSDSLSDEALMEIAGDILHVESVLEGLAAPPSAEASARDADSLLTDSELTGHVGAALQEIFVELAQIKEALGGYLDAPDEPGLLGRVPARLHAVAGAVQLLDLGGAGALLERTAALVGALSEGRRPALEAGQPEALADVLTGVEYYLEAVREHRPNRDEILGFAAQSAQQLGIEVELPAAQPEHMRPAEPEPETPVEVVTPGEIPPQPEAGEARPPLATEPSAEAADAPVAEQGVAPEPEPPSEPEAQPEPELGIPATTPSVTEEIDDEILETFFEEADEELERIGQAYPAWRRQPADAEALQTLRRSFHTLKGSGRLVGALTIGEFSWSLENLLNRVIDGSVAPGEGLFALLDEACAALPELVEAQRAGIPAGIDVAAVSARADALARAEPPAEETLEQAPVEEAPFEAAEPRASETPTAELEEQGEDEVPLEVAAEPSAERGVEPEPEVEPELDLAPPGEFGPEQEAAQEPAPEPEIEPAAESPAAAEERPAVPDEALPEFLMPEAETPEALGLEPLAGVAAQSTGAPPADRRDFATAAEEAFDDDTVDVDSTLLGIFCAEGRDHLDVLAAFIDRASREPLPVDAELQRAIHTLRGSAHTAGVGEIAALSGGYDHLIALLSARARPVDRVAVDLLERGHQALAEMLEAVDQGAERVPDGSELLGEVRAFNTGLEAEVEDSDRGYTAQEDSELLEIFFEESKELLEQIEEDFGRWQERPEDRHAVAGLQRSLHTLKGGARLTGITPIGDLSHVLESLFERVLNAELAAEPALFARVRRAVDHAAAALESLREGRPLPDLAGVTERLQALVTGELSATDADSDLPLVALPGEVAGVASVPEPRPSTSAEAELPAEAAERTAPVDEPEPVQAEDEGAGEAAAERPVGATPPDEVEVTEERQATSEPPEPEPVEPEPIPGGSRILQFPKGAVPTPPAAPAERAPAPEQESEPESASVERVRVRSDLLDNMVNHAGEVGIYRARLEQQNNLLGFDLQELDQTVSRLKDQLRKLEFETETQILSRHERSGDLPLDADFDPLEMDRYSMIQQLSRALSETVNDLTNLGTTLGDLKRDTDTLLGQQSRVSNDLQDSLLRSRMIPFSSRLARLQRVVRQTADSLGKQAELVVHGGQGEVDRSILDRMMGPLEHLLRNAVAHGIESREQRLAAGKPERGVITLELSREGPDVVLSVGDDGAGLNREAIRAKAQQRGLLAPEVRLDDDTLYQLILEHGFSTAESVSQIAGRGVGLDAVLREVKQLGGSLDVSSAPNSGARFIVRLPFTLALTEALLVTVGEDVYAVPHTGIESVVRISRDELSDFYEGRRGSFAYAGAEYQVRYLGTLLETGLPSLPKGQKWFPLMLARAGDHRVAVHADSLLGSRQIVIKSIGPQLSTVRWFTGGTILADGRIALILDMGALLRADARTARPSRVAMPEAAPQTVSVMVVDDSITVRKVTSRLLERHDMQVLTAKDGVDAVTLLQEHRPDVMLLDVEMPRMDGYELARHMRNTKELAQIPIIMITSRSGDKHRDYARQLGVEHYLGKPYQESELLDNIFKVLHEQEAS